MDQPPPLPDGKRDPLLGALVDERWQVVRPIGSGFMGVVYLAERVKLGRPVALKLLHEQYASQKDFVRRFDREARAISRLQHVNCISILDFGVHQTADLVDRPYIVMELVKGSSLTEEIEKRSMTPARAVSLMRQVLLGLQHAHDHSIIHRDLKPDNIMVTHVAGVGDVVKILDFGFAHLSDHNSQSNADVVPGTPSYMSPEQAQGIKTDLRTDLYSCGVILYQMCVGRKPFAAPDPMQVLKMHIQSAATPPRVAAPDRGISEALEQVIARALAKDREQRFASAAEFKAALEATPEVRGGEGSSIAGATSRARRGRLAIAVAVIVAALGVAAAFKLRERARPAPVEAPPVAATAPANSAGTTAASAPPASAPPASAPPASAPATVDAALAAGQLDDAERLLTAAIAKTPKDAQLHLQLGDVYFRQVFRKLALQEWNAALGLSPTLRHDRGLQHHLCAALDARSSAQAEEVLERNFGAGVVGVMNDCIRKTRDPHVLAAAVRVIEKTVGSAKVDAGLVARRQLELSSSCEERKRAVQTVARLRVRQAIPALHAIEKDHTAKNACLGQAVREALAQLK